MSSPVIEASTKLRLDSIRTNTPHAVLLSGPEGVGLSSVSRYITEGREGDILEVLPERNDVVDIEKGTITVKVIRRLYDTARTKGTKKYIVIDYAERMAKPAQNAFLKLLEEPNESIHFILLSHAPQTLLPTILSRVQSINVRPVSSRQSQDLLDSLGVTDANKRAQMLFMAGGLPAEMHRLQNDDYFQQRSSIVRDARDFISGTPYMRSLVAHKYRDDRVKAVLLLDDALKLLKRTLEDRKDPSLLSSTDKIISSRERIVGNGNIRLQLATAL